MTTLAAKTSSNKPYESCRDYGAVVVNRESTGSVRKSHIIFKTLSTYYINNITNNLKFDQLERKNQKLKCRFKVSTMAATGFLKQFQV